MSIQKRLLKEGRLEQYLPSTQFLDLMLQKPQSTEDLANKESDGMKLIGVGDLDDNQLKVITDGIGDMETDDKCHYSCMNYRGYPVMVKHDGPMRTPTHLILFNKDKNKHHNLEVRGPKLGL